VMAGHAAEEPSEAEHGVDDGAGDVQAAERRFRPANSGIVPRPKPLKPADIRALRTSLNASQALLARLLDVSSNAVWTPPYAARGASWKGAPRRVLRGNADPSTAAARRRLRLIS
jgi:DNA-binding transcriptional regulator YiaG